jgi:predicted amidohydrolase
VEVAGWHWRLEREAVNARAHAWETAVLVAQAMQGGIDRKFPRDLDGYLGKKPKKLAEDYDRRFEQLAGKAQVIPIRRAAG